MTRELNIAIFLCRRLGNAVGHFGFGSQYSGEWPLQLPIGAQWGPGGWARCAPVGNTAKKTYLEKVSVRATDRNKISDCKLLGFKSSGTMLPRKGHQHIYKPYFL